MKLFNDQAAAAVASLDSADAAYCAKNSILGIGCRGKYFIALEMDPEI